jgi:ParB/RepB/Spo0J family partition protein
MTDKKIADEALAAINKAARQAAASTNKPEKSSHPVGVLARPSGFQVDPTLITRREGWNPRFDFGDIEALAETIKYQKHLAGGPAEGHGLLNDLRVRRTGPGAFQLIDGDRRLTAIEYLMKKGEVFAKGVPVKIEADDDDLQALIRTFTANTGKPMLPLEEAEAFKRMRDAGMNFKAIEKATGRSDNVINDCLALLESDESVQEAVKTKKVTAGVAKKIAVYARGDKDAQRKLITEAKNAGKDKKARAELDKKIDAQRRTKAAKTGKVLKIRALSDSELSEIGSQVAQHLAVAMKDAKVAGDGVDLLAMVKKDDKLAMAFTLGALEALKVAAGQGGVANLLL